MPPVVVGVAAGYAAAGATIGGVLITTAGAVAIGVAAAAATHLLSEALVPDAPDVMSDPATDQALNTNPNESRKIVYGEQIVGGKIVGYAKPTINEKEYHVMVLHLVGHPCDSVDIYEIEGMDEGQLGNAIQINKYLGDQDSVDYLANQYIDGWTNDHIGRGQTYVVLKVEINQELFPSGLNEAKFKVRGRRVYDPRKDTTAGGEGAHRRDDESTWEWSNNPVLCAYDCLRNFGARPVPHRRIPWDFVALAATHCDEQVDYTDKDGNPQTGQRFAVNGVLNNGIRPGEMLSQIMSTMGAKPYRVGGKLYIKPAMYTGPATVTIKVDELDALPEYRPHRPYREKINTVRAEFVSPQKKWQMTGAPVVTSDAYKTKDRAYLETVLRLQMVTSDHQAQRLAKLKMERSRAGFFAYYPLPGIRLDVVPGMNVRFVDGQTGVNKEFLVEDLKFDTAKNQTNLSIVEDGDAIYPDDFVPAEGDLTPNTTLLDATDIVAPHSLTWTPTPNDSWRQGILRWEHESPAAVINYIVFIANEDGTPETAFTFTPATREQSVNNLPIGAFTAAVAARNRFKTSPAVTKPFNVAVPSTPTAALTVNVLPGRVVVRGPALPHSNATYEWRYLFSDDFNNALEGGLNTGITVTGTPHNGTLYVWYRLVDGDHADPNWLSVTVPDLIGLTSDEVDPEIISNITLPGFPDTLAVTLTGFSEAINQNADAAESLIETINLLDGKVTDVEQSVTDEAISSKVQTALADQDVATVTSVEQQINALGIENYVLKATFDDEVTRIDAAEEVLESTLFRRSLTSYTAAADADEDLTERLLASMADLLLAENERFELEGAFAFEREKTDINTSAIEAQATRTTQIESQFNNEFASAFQQIQTISNQNQTTAQELSQLKVETEEGIAEVQSSITATVGYCTLDGNLTGHTDKSACESAGGTWEQLPLAQALDRLRLTITRNGEEVTASAGSLLQLLTNDVGNIAGRAFFGLDFAGRVTGLNITDEEGNPQLGMIDILGGMIRLINPSNGQPFISFNTLDQVADIGGRITLPDGTVIGAVEDIQAQDGDDGDTIYTEEQYSVTGTGNWHWPAVTGDRFRRERIVTNGTPGPWSDAAQWRGDDGQDGDEGPQGPQGPQGIPGVDGIPGAAFHVLVLRNGIFPASSTASADFQSNFGRAPVLDDHLTYVKADETVSSTKRFNGSFWTAPSAIFSGDILVKGTVTGDRIAAGTEIVSPILKGGLLKAGAVQYGSAMMLGEQGKLGPLVIHEFAHEYSNGRANRTVQPARIYGPGYGSDDSYIHQRVAAAKSDILIKTHCTTQATSTAGTSLIIDVRYRYANTGNSNHNVWDTVRGTPIPTDEPVSGIVMMYRYTTRNDSWETLDIRVRFEHATTAEGRPYIGSVEYTIYNNVDSPYSAHTITGDNNDNNTNPPPPPLPPGGGYEP